MSKLIFTSPLSLLPLIILTMELSSFPAIDASPVSRRPSSFVSGPHVEKLPVELLIEIFALCAAEDSDAPLTLGTVCSTWNEIVNGSPRVWQVVILDDSEKSFATSQSRAKIWISRSAPLQFDLKLNVKDADNVLHPLAPFLPVLDRWRRLTITGAFQKCFHLSDASSRRSLLKEFNISIEDDAVDDHVFPRTHTQSLQNHPRMNIRFTHSPQASDSLLSTPLRFTSLKITDWQHWPRQGPSFTAVCSLLRACPQLESFTFYGWMDHRRYGSLPLVYLPSLHTMNIHESPYARVILSTIHAPALSELYLDELNMCLDDGFLGKPDDIENDPHDCVMVCRWSNHATGNGLRRLIAHCNPPLKTLVMSSSDIRFKDYLHVFERTTELEDLRLICSQMWFDDMVVKLLEPYAASKSPVHSLDVRLPCLRHLEIRSTSHISGDAIVRSVSKRVAFTNQLTYTLEVVIISDCEKFGAQHEARLMQVLGPRFRPE
ncbi:hypothetical protein EV361DRAFT_957601 [Lentinula raphanica]|uniref:F-box domain-containing protein n=1 Tax=Lentinula raphanica TaxID=153919 RepID=A0AA38UHL5_9AGAR|nr:hypothetical protein F5878DRAFT_609615 [Lentinula raphanica]KAJ3977785.1 hypothetical protein EV361DRAFT_957601 [Lentinula raphanica]